jgi:hypothetical protein
MPNITTFEILDNEIKKIGGKPIVLEALWDGDTQGWHLCLYLYSETGHFFNKKISRHSLGHITLGGDIRVFSGGQWTEAFLAKEFGKKAIEKYSLEFYFPSSEQPDDDCPKWTDRHLALKCTDCGKLIIPTDIPYLPKDVCYNCHLIREQNEKLVKNDLIQEGVILYLENSEKSEKIGFWGSYSYIIISNFKIHQINNIDSINSLTVFKLGRLEITNLKNDILNELNHKLSIYEKPVINEMERRFSKSNYEVEHNGIKYQLETRQNKDHNSILEYIRSLKYLEKALTENYDLKICFLKGLTYQDDKILRHINYVCKGKAEIEKIVEDFKKLLTQEQILESLQKLEELRCLVVFDKTFALTELGKNII